MNVHIIEMALDYGASRRGADMGPSAIRLAGLREKLCELEIKSTNMYPPINVPPQEYIDPSCELPLEKATHLGPILEACEQLAQNVEATVTRGDFPLTLGGDHSIALGTIAGISAAHKKAGRSFGVLMVDAHGDFNTTETTPSGNIHGMILAASCGLGNEHLTNFYFPEQKLNPKNLCYIGVRDLDPGERKLMKQAGVTVFTMSDIVRHGIAKTISQIVQFFKDRVDTVHISFDMDGIDPRFAPGVGIAVPGGMNYREALFLMEEMHSLGMVSSCDMVEVNPIHDVKNSTARMAVELIARLFGETVY